MLLRTAFSILLRQPSNHIVILVVAQLLVGIGSSLSTARSQLAITAAVIHQEIAIVLAIWSMFASVGSSIGSAIAGGVWNIVFLSILHRDLPDGSKDQSNAIFSDMVVQMSYADGTPGRDTIIETYAYVQRLVSLLVWQSSR
jgi:hypothetical protein